MLPNEKQSFICFHLAPLRSGGEQRRRAGIQPQVSSLCRWLWLLSDGRRLPQGVHLNTLSPCCSTTKTHAEQRHFHHVSHSSWLTGTVKSSLIPPLRAGALAHGASSSCVPGSPGWPQHQQEPRPSRAPTERPNYGKNKASLMSRSAWHQAGGRDRAG